MQSGPPSLTIHPGSRDARVSGARSDPAPNRISGPPPEIELRQLHYALAIAEELHFTRAAEKLHLTQSALSRQIQQLEATLGIELFRRGTRRVELTEAGEVFMYHARKTLEQARVAVQHAQAVGRGEPSEFLITHSPFVDIHLVTTAQEVIDAAKPRIPVRYRSVSSFEQISLLISGLAQAALTLLPIDTEELNSVCLLREQLLVALPAQHRLARKRHIRVSEVGDDSVVWLARELQPAFVDHLLKLFRKAGYTPNVTREVQSVAEALGFVREGGFVSFLKSSEERLQGGEGFVLRPVAERFLVIETGISYLRDNPSDFLKELIQILTNHFQCDVDTRPLASGSVKSTI